MTRSDQPAAVLRGGIPMSDERRLVEALAAGSPGVLEDFLVHTHHAVFALACRLTLDRDHRRDWCHTTLLGIVDDVRRGRFVFRRPGGFWTWFRKRAYFRLMDECRRVAREQARTRSGDDPVHAPDLASFGLSEDPALEFERVALLADVERCLEGVDNAEHRRALRLLLEDEATYQQIADVLGAPLNTVRVWILRGRRALRRCLASRWGLPRAESGERNS